MPDDANRPDITAASTQPIFSPESASRRRRTGAAPLPYLVVAGTAWCPAGSACTAPTDRHWRQCVDPPGGRCRGDSPGRPASSTERPWDNGTRRRAITGKSSRPEVLRVLTNGIARGGDRTGVVEPKMVVTRRALHRARNLGFGQRAAEIVHAAGLVIRRFVRALVACVERDPTRLSWLLYQAFRRRSGATGRPMCRTGGRERREVQLACIHTRLNACFGRPKLQRLRRHGAEFREHGLPPRSNGLARRELLIPRPGHPLRHSAECGDGHSDNHGVEVAVFTVAHLRDDLLLTVPPVAPNSPKLTCCSSSSTVLWYSRRVAASKSNCSARGVHGQPGSPPTENQRLVVGWAHESSPSTTPDGRTSVR